MVDTKDIPEFKGSSDILVGRIMLVGIKSDATDSTGLVTDEAMKTGATDIDSVEDTLAG